MAPAHKILAPMAGSCLLKPCRRAVSLASPHLTPGVLVHRRQASAARATKAKASNAAPAAKSTISKQFDRHDLDKREFPRYSLVEAMRILRAYEVGKPPVSVKYDISINLYTDRVGAVVRGSFRPPHPIVSEWRIGVICKEDSDVAVAAGAAGAVCIGEEVLFNEIRNGIFRFDRLLCHVDSVPALQKARLGPILGPQGLLPSERMKTIVRDVAKAIREAGGALDFRERQGVIRFPVGQLGHTAEQLKANIQAAMEKIKAQCAMVSEKTPKTIHEVILSTTNGPGVSLSGKLTHDDDEYTAEHVSSAM